MGHPIDIFLSQPPESCICSICHDVFHDAVVMKECGHSFCGQCGNTCISRSSTCPTCRTQVSGSVPNFTARDMISAMKVKCISQCNDEGGANKRMKGDDGKMGAAESNSCGWSGLCEDLKKHEDICEFKVITCSVQGCDHQCRRKDMSVHLSGNGLLLHLDLMQRAISAKYEQQISTLNNRCKDLEGKYAQSAAKIIELEEKVNSMNIERATTELRNRTVAVESAVLNLLRNGEFVIMDCIIAD
jgi:hypothetical protein